MGIRTRLSALALLALAVAPPAAAQQARGPRVGIGVSLTEPGHVYVPIDVLPQLRIEPQVGIHTVDVDAGNDAKVFTVGIGAFFLVPVGEQAHLYVGPRAGLARLDATDPNGSVATTTKATDRWIAAALGGELLAHPRVGFGAEAQIAHTWLGQHEATTAGITEVTQRSATAVDTVGVVFVRVYFL